MKDLLSVKGGKRIPKGEKLLDIPTKHIYIRVTDMKNNTIDSSKIKYISDEIYEQIKNYTISSNDLYLTIAGTIGSVGIIPKEFDNMNLTENAVKLCNLLINKKLLLYFIQSQFIQNQFVDKTNKVAQPKLAIVRIESTLIPLPPKSEQERIISKLVLLLQYIKIYSEKNKLIEELNSSYKEELKKSILQYAIQGKLIPQNPNDESADILINKILEEKRELIKIKQIKKENLSVIYEDDTDNQFYEKFDDGTIVNITDEITIDIPQNWRWVRLKNIVYNHGQKKPDTTFSYIDIGTLDNINHKLNENENIIESNQAPSRARKIVKKGDVLYSTVRPYLHNICVVDKDFSKEPIASTGFAVLTCLTGIYNKYLFHLLLTPFFDSYANSNENAKGVAYPAINDEKLYKALIPIPPRSEQKKIVDKLEKVFNIIG